MLRPRTRSVRWRTTLLRPGCALLASVMLMLPAALVASACNSTREGVKGAACDRATECSSGLFCVERVCSDDLSKLDGGNLPQFDTGADVAELDSPGTDADETSDAAADAPPPADGEPPPDTRPAPDTTPSPMDTKPAVDTEPLPDTATDDAGSD